MANIAEKVISSFLFSLSISLQLDNEPIENGVEFNDLSINLGHVEAPNESMALIVINGLDIESIRYHLDQSLNPCFFVLVKLRDM